MEINFRRPTKADSKEFIKWKYTGVCSFYNNDKTEAKRQWIENIHEDETVYVIYNENNEIIGNCCFEFDDEDQVYTLGVQMRPDLVGKGNGKVYLSAILEFGRQEYKYDSIVLYVAKFNKRAIKLYTNLGFIVIDEFTTMCNEENTDFIVMKKIYIPE